MRGVTLWFRVDIMADDLIEWSCHKFDSFYCLATFSFFSCGLEPSINYVVTSSVKFYLLSLLSIRSVTKSILLLPFGLRPSTNYFVTKMKVFDLLPPLAIKLCLHGGLILRLFIYTPIVGINVANNLTGILYPLWVTSLNELVHILFTFPVATF